MRALNSNLQSSAGAAGRTLSSSGAVGFLATTSPNAQTHTTLTPGVELGVKGAGKGVVAALEPHQGGVALLVQRLQHIQRVLRACRRGQKGVGGISGQAGSGAGPAGPGGQELAWGQVGPQ